VGQMYCIPLPYFATPTAIGYGERGRGTRVASYFLLQTRRPSPTVYGPLVMGDDMICVCQSVILSVNRIS